MTIEIEPTPRWSVKRNILGSTQFLTPWFGIFWGRGQHMAVDFYVLVCWKRIPKTKRHQRIFVHGVEIGWDWLPRLAWHDNWLGDDGDPKPPYWRRRSLRGIRQWLHYAKAF